MVNLHILATAATSCAVLFYLRVCSLQVWLACMAVPIIYGLVGEQTKATAVHGKHFLITGASSGLGKSFAINAARRGAQKVVLMSRSKEALEMVAEECRAVATHNNFVVVVVPCDVSSIPEIRRAVKTLPRIDILINNAGSGEWEHIERTSPEDGQQMMAVPYQGAFSLSSLLIPTMVDRPHECHIINVTSAASLVGFRGAVGYGVARMAMRGFNRYLARDLQEIGIGCTLLCAAEITEGTSYFNNAPGKAGSNSRSRIPTMFQIVAKIIPLTTTGAANTGLDAMEAGMKEVYTPALVVLPFRMLNDIMPDLGEWMVRLGPAGLRSTTVKEQ